jgi:hypothetical protein
MEKGNKDCWRKCEDSDQKAKVPILKVDVFPFWNRSEGWCLTLFSFLPETKTILM